MELDPLYKVKLAYLDNRISNKLYDLIFKGFAIVKEGIYRIEDSTNIKFPFFYIEPNLIVSYSSLDLAEYGLLFARTIPILDLENKLNIIIQVMAPLLAYGTKSSIYAILGHEFLHYLHLLSKITRMDIVSDNQSNNFYECIYEDLNHLVDPKKVFHNDKILLNYITNKFGYGFKDSTLENKVVQKWVNVGLPIKIIKLEDNNIKIPVEYILNFSLNSQLSEKLTSLGN
jgi:hypothetical protein